MSNQTPFHKCRQTHDFCAECRVPAGVPVHMSKSRPGLWTLDYDDDLASSHPEEWTKKTASHRIRANGLCDRCHAIQKQQEAA